MVPTSSSEPEKQTSLHVNSLIFDTRNLDLERDLLLSSFPNVSFFSFPTTHQHLPTPSPSPPPLLHRKNQVFAAMESQLASILLATLSPDASTRRQAENELESVLANPGESEFAFLWAL